MTIDLLIRDVRPWGGPAVDCLLSGGLIAEVGAGLQPPPGAATAAGRGRILLPSFTDAHVHLDSTRLGLPFRAHTAGPSLAELIADDRAHWRDAEWTVTQRASHTLGVAIACGATRFRAYAQVDADCGLERLDGVLAAKEAHANRADVTVMAFPQAGVLLEPGVPALLGQALAAGAEVIGGSTRAGWTATRSGTWTWCSAWPSSTPCRWTSTCTSAARSARSASN